MDMDSYPVPVAFLHGTCSIIATKVQNLATTARLRADDDETASRLACQTEELEAAVKKLVDILSDATMAVSGFTAETVRSTLAASDNIISGVRNYIRPCILGPQRAVWEEKVVKTCQKMLGTQIQVMGLLVKALSP